MFHLLCTAIKFQQPPVLPPNYIPRHELLEELVSAVMSTELEPNRFGSTVTITGVGGFGKSVLAKALCHHNIIKAKFKSGFVFVELGPKSFDPVVELHQLYYLLTGKEFPSSQLNTTNIVKEVRQVTIHHSDKLLIIIDDVWHVEDVEPIVEAFNNCKTIITTRKNEISQQIPSKCTITAGPMEPHEAISLLIDGVVLQTQLTENNHTSLDNIAHDVHLWPLLLSLVRGQLTHYITQHLPLNKAIKLIHQKLYAKGLTAFDRNNVGSNIRNRKNAVKACIESTLDLLQKSDSDKMKVIILFSGIGCAVPTVVLHVIWKTSSLEANDTMSVLWGHGLVTYGSSVVPCFGIHQRHIEVHATISQFIIETMQNGEVMQLTPYLNLDTAVPSFASAVYEEFLSCYGSPKLTSLSDKEYLKYHLDQLEYFAIPYQLRYANMWAIFDPHMVNYTVLQPMFKVFTTIGFTNFNLSTMMSSFSSQVTALISDCQKVIRDICRSKKTLYQLSMKHLVEKNYNDLLQELEDYHKQYPIGPITEKSVRLVNDFMAYCQGNYKIHSICKEFLAGLKLVTAPYHLNNLVVFPMIRMYIDHCKRIRNSLHSNSTEIRQTVEYFKSDKWEEDMELIKINYQIKIQEVAPNFMHTLLAKLKSME